MHLKRVTNHLLFLTLIYLPHTDAEFIRAVKGATVLLPCHSIPDDFDDVSVKWINKATSKTICEWRINKTYTEYSIRQCPRFTYNRTSLIIENVQFSDSGNYSCKTTRIIPPPSVENISDLRLQVEAPPRLSLKQNSGNDSCILLLCSLEGLNPELVNFTWIREGRGLLYSSTSYDMNSSLLLCKPDWSDGDTIICRANYSNNQNQTQIKLTSENGFNKGSDHTLFVTITVLVISVCSAAAGLILCIIPIVVFCKCRKRDENGSIVFTNKVYENFSFALARQNTKPEPEECIYEN
ncbi:hypothetical protein PO909_022612 [Leuciscus waleckii]